MKVSIVVNPYANRWQCQTHLPAVESAFKAAGIDVQVFRSEAPGHAVELASLAAKASPDGVFAMGGDGTVGDVLNGVMRAAQQSDTLPVPLGVLPFGTANDLAYALQIPPDPQVIAQALAANKKKKIDLGWVNERWFINNAAVGLEPQVTINNANMKRVKGIIRYLLAALQGIWQRPTWDAYLEWRNENGEQMKYQGSLTLVSIGNARRTGGVFFMTPNAIPDDGLLDFVFAPTMSRLHLLRLLPKTQAGTHLQDPVVRSGRFTHLLIRTAPQTNLQTDGELQTPTTQVEFRVIPGAISLFVP